jgi:hypothetical protein
VVEVGLCPRERKWTELFGILDDFLEFPMTFGISERRSALAKKLGQSQIGRTGGESFRSRRV